MISKFIYILRWLLVIPIAFLGFHFAFFLFYSYIGYLDIFWPPSQFDAELIFPGTAALFVVVGPYFAAPDYREIVASVAYVAGLFSAAMLTLPIKLYAEFITAAAVGGLTLLCILYRAHAKVSTPLTDDKSQFREFE